MGIANSIIAGLDHLSMERVRKEVRDRLIKTAKEAIGYVAFGKVFQQDICRAASLELNAANCHKVEIVCAGMYTAIKEALEVLEKEIDCSKSE